MKSNLILKIAALSLLFGLLCLNETQAQKKTATRLRAYYEKLPDNNRQMSFILTKGRGKNMQGVTNADIKLNTYDENEEELELAFVTTDEDGRAAILIEADYRFYKNEDGYYTLKATYGGNDSLKSARRTVEFMDLNIDVSFEVEDSTKLLTVATFELDSAGEKKPVGEIDLMVGVERLYTTLYLEETETDEDGLVEIEFPNDLPGDSLGMINVVIKVDDHDDYGTITKMAGVDWGLQRDYTINSNGRSLFGDEAPMWMIIALFVILAGAWFHFVLAVVKVMKMKKIGRELSKQ